MALTPFPYQSKNGPTVLLALGCYQHGSFAWDQIRATLELSFFIYYGPFDPIWGLFVSSEKYELNCIHLSCRVLFLFFSIRDQIKVVSSVVISYHQQTSQPTLYVCSYKNHQPSLLHNDHSQWSHNMPFVGAWVLIYFTVSFADLIRVTYHIPVSSFYCVPLLSHLCDLFLQNDR